MPTLAYVGLDVGQRDVHVCFVRADGSEPLPRWTCANDQPGATTLVQRLAELCQHYQVDSLRIGLEATGLLWWHLACTLSTAAALTPYCPRIFVLNPMLVHAFRANYGAMSKTDHADAYLIAERVRWGRTLPAPFQIDVRYAPLQRLTRFRCHVVHTLAREKGYFLSLLFLPFSAFVQHAPFGDPFSATSQAVLDEFTTEDVAQAELPDLVTFLQQKGHNHFADPEAVAQTLQRAARDSYQLHQVLQEPLGMILGTTLATIRVLQAQLRRLDKTIAHDLRGVPTTLNSVPGLGPVWTAGLVAEIGNIHRFRDEAALAQFAGVTWKAHQSGMFQADDTSLSKQGNTYLRYYLVEAANSVRIHCPEYAQYYHMKYAESPKHAHKRALVLTARKLVRLVDALLRSGRLYQAPHARQGQEVYPKRHQRPKRQRHARRATATA
jgi:transposase